MRSTSIRVGIVAALLLPSLLLAAGPDPAKVTVYVTNYGREETHVYHREGCGALYASKHPITLAEAARQGYRPCERCGAPRPPAQPKIDNGKQVPIPSTIPSIPQTTPSRPLQPVEPAGDPTVPREKVVRWMAARAADIITNVKAGKYRPGAIHMSQWHPDGGWKKFQEDFDAAFPGLEVRDHWQAMQRALDTAATEAGLGDFSDEETEERIFNTRPPSFFFSGSSGFGRRSAVSSGTAEVTRAVPDSDRPPTLFSWFGRKQQDGTTGRQREIFGKPDLDMSRPVKVDGYQKQDGTNVRPYTRSYPNR